MAVEQSAQLAGLGPLIRPKPHPLLKKTKPLVSSLDSENAAMTMPGPKTSGSANTTQNAVNTGKNKYQDLKITFKDGVKANQKVSNTSVSTLSQTTSESSTPCSEEVGVRKWVKNVVSKSQLQPSVPSSTQSAQAVSNNNSEWTEDVDAPETFDEQMVRNRAGKTAKDASRGKKCAFSDSLEEEEECKVQDDPDADEGPNVDDPVDDMDDDVKMVDQQLPEVGTKMSVDIVKSDDSKPVKTESAANQRKTISLKKEKPKNAHLRSHAQNGKWCSKFLPAVMYWVGNSNYPWTIPNEKLSDVCYNIFSVVYNGVPGEFEADSWSGGFHVSVNYISAGLSKDFRVEGSLGSTAVSVLVMFFTSNDDFQAPKARKKYAEYQLEDSCFVYEDPDNEDSPGAFLSEFILHVFAAHLDAIQGYEKIDIIDCGLPGHQAALALATAAAYKETLRDKKEPGDLLMHWPFANHQLPINGLKHLESGALVKDYEGPEKELKQAVE
ncbi:uncharacterized protein F5147DRAFT_655191 [Suillus discolor]|uniref:Uncharacterized protein n=1 Tax=Suillus discolor TaxID=1912936 RepID=A0A9P7F260_9AGAM|nr:uncharacterized protein F5147DRAFT_655191 [Suillus discolor]KAG2101878.1 hypothetical protein F5147DRAFT_655191 [Suillus discolor]